MSIVAERVTLDPIEEDASLQPLDVVGTDPSWGIYLLTHDYPAPKPETIHSSSADTEGEAVVSTKYGNRNLSLRLRIFEPSDPASTSLVTNPLAALAATTWAGKELSAGPTRVEVPTNVPRIGTDTAIEAATAASGSYVYHDTINVTNGKTYRASIYVQLRALSATGVRIVVYNAAGAAKKAEGTTYSTVDTTTSGWVRLDVSFKADATAAWRVGVEQVGAGAATVRVTGLLVEASETLTAFFCGDTPGCDWSGGRHESTSTRPAPDGTRFSRIYRDALARVDRVKRTKRGTLRRIAPGFSPITYDLRVAEVTEAPQDLGIGMKRAEIALGYEALPGGRGPEVQIGGNYEETTLPALVFTAKDVPGDMPALGRLVLEDRSGSNQQIARWGFQSESYDAATTARLYYEAEELTLIGTAAKAAQAGASGGNVVTSPGLVSSFQPIIGLKLSSGEYLTHAGTYRVLARTYRPEANSGEVSLMLAYAQGTFSSATENTPAVAAPNDRENTFTIVDLGLVTLTGEKWEGFIFGASSFNGDKVSIDSIMLIPVDEGSGVLEIADAKVVPSLLSMADAFTGTAEGNVTGKSAELGGVYEAMPGSDTTDFQITTHQLWRSATSDTGTKPFPGRGIGTPLQFTDVAVSSDFYFPDEGPDFGHVVSYVDSKHFVAIMLYSLGLGRWNVYLTFPDGSVEGPEVNLNLGPENSPLAGRLISVVRGSVVSAYIEISGVSPLKRLWTIEDTEGMAGKKGKVFFYDQQEGPEGLVRKYDNLKIWVPAFDPAVDAAVFANQKAEVQSNLVRRRSDDGQVWGSIPYSGDHLLLPPAGREKTVSRFIAKLSRFPDSDPVIDDVRANLYVTPRYLQAPPT